MKIAFDIGGVLSKYPDVFRHLWRCLHQAEQLGIDILIDDHMAYVSAPGAPVRLLVMPDPEKDYYAPEWETDGSEGNFGRRRNPPESKRPGVTP